MEGVLYSKKFEEFVYVGAVEFHDFANDRHRRLLLLRGPLFVSVDAA
jgi:hypothetical protein